MDAPAQQGLLVCQATRDRPHPPCPKTPAMDGQVATLIFRREDGRLCPTSADPAAVPAACSGQMSWWRAVGERRGDGFMSGQSGFHVVHLLGQHRVHDGLTGWFNARQGNCVGPNGRMAYLPTSRRAGSWQISSALGTQHLCCRWKERVPRRGDVRHETWPRHGAICRSSSPAPARTCQFP